VAQRRGLNHLQEAPCVYGDVVIPYRRASAPFVLVRLPCRFARWHEGRKRERQRETERERERERERENSFTKPPGVGFGLDKEVPERKRRWKMGETEERKE